MKRSITFSPCTKITNTRSLRRPHRGRATRQGRDTCVQVRYAHCAYGLISRMPSTHTHTLSNSVAEVRARKERKKITSLCKSLKFPILKCIWIGCIGRAPCPMNAHACVSAHREPRCAFACAVRGHLHVKRRGWCNEDGEAQRRRREEEDEETGGGGGKGEGGEDAFARAEVVRICTSCAYRAEENDAERAPPACIFPGTTLRRSYSWLHRFANRRTFVCARYTTRDRAGRSTGWLVGRSESRNDFNAARKVSRSRVNVAVRS